MIIGIQRVSKFCRDSLQYDNMSAQRGAAQSRLIDSIPTPCHGSTSHLLEYEKQARGLEHINVNDRRYIERFAEGVSNPINLEIAASEKLLRAYISSTDARHLCRALTSTCNQHKAKRCVVKLRRTIENTVMEQSEEHKNDELTLPHLPTTSLQPTHALLAPLSTHLKRGNI